MNYKKLTEDAENLENWLKVLKEANDALREGFGPAHNSDKLYVAIPGIVKDKAIPGLINDKAYYALVIEKDENGARPVDWFAWSPKPNFPSGFGGWYKYDGYEFIKANPWVEDELPNLTKKIKAVFEK